MADPISPQPLSANARPFDDAARRRARDRAAGLIAGREQLLRHVETELLARAALLGPGIAGPELRIGLLLPPPAGAIGLDPSPVLAQRHGPLCLCGAEDAPHFANARFARVTAFMTLHGVNDLPGAFALVRRMLKKGGRFQAALPAGFSLAAVRDAFLEADIAGDRGVPPRVGPTIDPREAAPLLLRAGLRQPVAEVESLTLRYRNLADFARDARAHGDSGWLMARPRGLMTPARWALAEQAFASGADADGRVPVEVQILYLSAVAS